MERLIENNNRMIKDAQRRLIEHANIILSCVPDHLHASVINQIELIKNNQRLICMLQNENELAFDLISDRNEVVEDV